jgi:hypothetical protein
MEEFIAEGKREIADIENPRRNCAASRASSRTAERRPRFGDCFSGRAARFDEIYGRIFRRRFCRISRHYSPNNRRRTKTRRFPQDLKPIVCAKILYGALDEMVTNWILSKKSYPLAPMADEVLKVFFNGRRFSKRMSKQIKKNRIKRFRVSSAKLITAHSKNMTSKVNQKIRKRQSGSRQSRRIPLFTNEPETLPQLFRGAAEKHIRARRS